LIVREVGTGKTPQLLRAQKQLARPTATGISPERWVGIASKAFDTTIRQD
jgi:hypothetical protein